MSWKRVLAATFLTLALFALSRVTGPNFRYRVEATAPGVTISHKAPRTSEGTGAAKLDLEVRGEPSALAGVTLTGRPRGRTSAPDRLEPVSITQLTGGPRTYHFEVPFHPWATKYQYAFEARLADGRLLRLDRDGEPMVVRFRGIVPPVWLGLHVAGMFGGFLLMILGAFAAVDFLRSRGDSRPVWRLSGWGWLVFAIGGLPLGFLMNWYAFRVIWEAWPFGADVTDNKTQAALLAHGIAVLLFLWKRNKPAAALVLGGTLVSFAVFLIPHSI